MFTRTQPLILLASISAMMMVQDAAAFQSVAPRGEIPPRAALVRMLANLESQKAVLKTKVESVRIETLEMDKKVTELMASKPDPVIAVESYPEVITSLHSQRVQLMITVAGLEARRAAILAATEDMAAKPIEKEILMPLEESVKLRAEMLETAQRQFDNGQVPKSILLQSRLALLQAKSQLAEKQATARNSETRDQLTQSLLDTSLELAERKAMLAETESLVSRIEPAQKKFVELEKIERVRRQYDTELRMLEDQLEAVEFQIEAIKEQEGASK